MDLIYNVIPPPSLEQGTEVILRAMDLMASQGITSVSDAAPATAHPLNRNWPCIEPPYTVGSWRDVSR
jgi:predicted amidohydrolase YtcJ